MVQKNKTSFRSSLSMEGTLSSILTVKLADINAVKWKPSSELWKKAMVWLFSGFQVWVSGSGSGVGLRFGIRGCCCCCSGLALCISAVVAGFVHPQRWASIFRFFIEVKVSTIDRLFKRHIFFNLPACKFDSHVFFLQDTKKLAQHWKFLKFSGFWVGEFLEFFEQFLFLE